MNIITMIALFKKVLITILKRFIPKRIIIEMSCFYCGKTKIISKYSKKEKTYICNSCENISKEERKYYDSKLI